MGNYLEEEIAPDGWRILRSRNDTEEVAIFELARMSPKGDAIVSECYLHTKEKRALIAFLGKAPAKKRYRITCTFDRIPKRIVEYDGTIRVPHYPYDVEETWE